jgi:cysteinyl-tRNA synthetase
VKDIYIMTLQFYNTLTKKKEEFKELEKDKVGLYTCGPTVYNFAHIGNLRAFTFYDLLKRYLRYRNYEVKHVMNITDVDDKTIKGAKEEGVSLKQFTQKYTNEFIEDLKTLNIELPDEFPSAIKHIQEMVELIKKLLEKKIAYKGDDGSIYYSVSKAKDYGKFAGLDLKNLKAGARVSHDEYDKENVADFALWKAWDEEDGDVFWETDLGKGRPGWHIECSAMSMKYLGETFDIHTGGIDLIFPHHENEIAQSEGATGKKFCNYWLHSAHLLVEGKKMSKSLGNFYTLRDLLDKKLNVRAIRYLLLATHYRQQLNFTFEAVEGAKNSLERIDNFVNMLKNCKGNEKRGVETLIQEAKDRFRESMDDDLNISEGLAHIFEFVREINTFESLTKQDASKVIECMEEFDSVLGILREEEKVPDEIMKLVNEREEARKSKEWDKSDFLRDKIHNFGYVLEDTPDGVRVKKV